MRRLMLVVAAVAAVLAPNAGAGGWATVQLSAVPGDGTKAGTTLPIDITVLQHGRTPLAGVTPVFRIRDADGTVRAAFRGSPTGRTGVYHVDVRFSAAGAMRYEVDDGFVRYGGAQTHTYAPVRVVGSGSSGGFPVLPVGVGILLLVVLAAVGTAVFRRGRAERTAQVA